MKGTHILIHFISWFFLMLILLFLLSPQWFWYAVISLGLIMFIYYRAFSEKGAMKYFLFAAIGFALGVLINYMWI